MAGTLHGLFEESARRHPHNVAIVFDDGEVVVRRTYIQLQQDICQVARVLRSLGVQGEIIGLCCPPSQVLPSLILGVLSVPASYHPIDLSGGEYCLQAVTALHIRYVFTSMDSLQDCVECWGLPAISFVHNQNLLENGVQLLKLSDQAGRGSGVNDDRSDQAGRGSGVNDDRSDQAGRGSGANDDQSDQAGRGSGVNNDLSDLAGRGSDVNDDQSDQAGRGSGVNDDRSDQAGRGSGVNDDRSDQAGRGSGANDDQSDQAGRGSGVNNDLSDLAGRGSDVNDDQSDQAGRGSGVNDDRSDQAGRGSDVNDDRSDQAGRGSGLNDDQSDQAGRGSGVNDDRSDQAGRGSGVNDDRSDQAGRGSGVNDDQSDQAGRGSGVNDDRSDQAGRGSGVNDDQSGQAGSGSGVNDDRSDQAGRGSGVNDDRSDQVGRGSGVNDDRSDQAGRGSGLNNDRLAYCITTSGTTGTPKVIKVPHACIVPNILHIRELFEVVDNDLLYLVSPLTFDTSVVELFVAFSSGSTILITPKIHIMVPSKFVTMATVRHHVTVLQVTPALLSNLGEERIPVTLLRDTSSLRVMAIGGEACPSPATLARWRQPRNTTAIFNLYGTTEVSCWATYYRIPDSHLTAGEEDAVPLGLPLRDTEIEVRDEAGHIVTHGEGYLFIGGSVRVCHIGPGSSRSGQSADRVMRDTGDVVTVDGYGRLVYRGRRDQQTKRHGQRLNLTTLEGIVGRVDHISAATAVMHKGRLLLFVCSSIASDTSAVSAVESKIKRCLPAQYFPDTVLCLPSLPLTRHGKVDKRALTLLTERAPAPGPPAVRDVGSLEELLRQTWQECLSVSVELDENHNFLQSGGDSFAAVRLVNKIEAVVGKTLPLLMEKIFHEPFWSVKNYLTSSLKETESVSNGDEALDDGFQTNSSSETVTVLQDHTQVEGDSGSDMGRLTSTSERLNTSHTAVIQTSGYVEHKAISSDSPCNTLDDFNLSLDSVTASEKGKRRITDGISCSVTKKQPKLLDKLTCDGLGVSVSRGGRIILYDTTGRTSTGLCNISLTKLGKEFLHQSTGSTTVGYRSQMFPASRVVHMQEKWRYNMGKCVDSSPMLILCSGNEEGLVFIGCHSHLFSAVSMTTGQPLWETWLGDRVESSPCITPCRRFVVVGCYDHCVYFLRIGDGSIYLKFQTDGEVKSSAVADRQSGLVFVGSHDQHLYAFNAETRTCSWKSHLGGGSVFSSPVVCDNPRLVIAATLRGSLVAVDPVDGVEAWRYRCDKPVFSSPAVCGGVVCVGSVDGFVYFLDLEGHLLWKYKTGGAIFSSPSFCKLSSLEKAIVIGSHDHHVYCLSPTGRLVWRADLGGAIYSTPFPFSTQHACCGSVFRESVGERSLKGHVTYSGEICDCIPSKLSMVMSKQGKSVEAANCLGINDGRCKNKDYLTAYMEGSEQNCSLDSCDSSPCSDKELEACGGVVACSTDGCVYVLDPRTGNSALKYRLPHQVFSSPVEWGGCVYLGCRDDHLYCLEITV